MILQVRVGSLSLSSRPQKPNPQAALKETKLMFEASHQGIIEGANLMGIGFGIWDSGSGFVVPRFRVQGIIQEPA